MTWSDEEMALRAAAEIPEGAVVNLGIGLPTLVADVLPPGQSVWLQSENGLLGMGPFPYPGDEDPQLINAGKQTVTALPGASFFDSATSFAMIRGGHVDVAVLGALQVGCDGDLANWQIPGRRTMGIGGAMDLAAGARRVVVLTKLAARTGEPKLVDEPTYPLTALGVVDRVISEVGVLDPDGDAFVLVERAPGVTRAAVQQAVGAPVR